MRPEPAHAGFGDHERSLNRNYRYQRHVYDLTRRYYLLGRDTLLDGLAPGRDATVLEIGCGTARNLVLLAKRYPEIWIHGIDLSRMMLNSATGKLARQGLEARVHLAHGDACTFDPVALFNRAEFDRIFFSYTLSMIPDWRTALSHAMANLSPNGSLHIVDFGRGDELPDAANIALRAWLRKFHVTPRDDLETVLRGLAARHGASLFESPIYRGYAHYAVLRR